MQTVLLTGGSGYIGTHTCLTLLKSGFNVIVIDSNINSKKIALKRVLEIYQSSTENYNNQLFFIKGDTRDEKLLNEIFEKAQCKKIPIEAVIHLAGLKSVRESINNPLTYWNTNVCGSITLFKCMMKHNCNTIVFSSSATIYGMQEKGLSIKEDAILSPINPYGENKLTIEKILKNIFDGSKKKWRIANLRYFNPIGADSSGLIGEEPRGIPNNIFPYICQVAAGKIDELKIFGSDWPTKDGTCIRDYIHVLDLADAHKSALDYLNGKDSQYVNLNIGTGNGTSVLELVKTFINVNRCNLKYKFGARRLGDPCQVVANNELALNTLEWKPKKNIEDMCRDGWRWQIYSKELMKNSSNIKLQKLL